MQLNKSLEEKIKENYYYFLKLDEYSQNNKKIVLNLLDINLEIYFLLNEELSKDIDIISKVINLRPEIIKEFTDEILLDKQISKLIFKTDPLAHQVYTEKNILNKVYISVLPSHIFGYLSRLEKK